MSIHNSLGLSANRAKFRVNYESYKIISHLHVLVNISQLMHKLDVRISEIKPDTKPPENPLVHLTKLDPLYFHTIDSLNRNHLDTLNLSRLVKKNTRYKITNPNTTKLAYATRPPLDSLLLFSTSNTHT